MCYQKTSLFFIICFTVFKINAQSVGGTVSGTATRCAGGNSGAISLNGSHGSILNWESSTDGGATWTNINNTGYYLWYNGLLVSTCFRAIVQDAGYPPDSSSVGCITIYPQSIGGTVSGAGTFCIVPGSGSGTLTLTGATGAVLFWQHSIDGGISWDTIANTSATLPFTNITHNTIYTAVVRSGPASSITSTDTIACPTDTSTQASFIFDSVTVAGIVTSNDTACYGVNGNTLNLTGSIGSILNWLSSIDNGSTWSAIINSNTSQIYSNLTQTTWYSAIVQNGACATDTSAYAIITVVAPSPMSAGSDVTITQGQSTVLNGTGIGSPVWTPSSGLDNTNKFMPIATPDISTSYILTVTDKHSCVSSDTVSVTVNPSGFNGVISNLFTPNGDGINDSWYIQDIQNYPDNEVFVYNIYGNLVYTKKGYTNDWQGTYKGSPLPDGTYYYVLRFDNSNIISKGSLDILKNK